MTKIFYLVIKRSVLSATSHADSTGDFKEFYGESFRKTPATPNVRAASFQMPLASNAPGGRFWYFRYVQCAERMRKRDSRGL